MPAMHDIVLKEMQEQLEKKCGLYLRTIPFVMTHDECLQLVAPAAHHALLRTAAEVAMVSASECWMELEVPAIVDGASSPKVVMLMRYVGGKAPPLVPRSPWWQMPTANNIGASTKVIDWLTKRYEIGRRFGTARHVLNRLNDECSSGAQLRYMFPAVLHLCKVGANPKMDAWVERFGPYKACRHTPSVSPDFKRAIQDSSALLTSVALMGEDVPEAERTEVMIDVQSMQGFKVDGRTTTRM